MKVTTDQWEILVDSHSRANDICQNLRKVNKNCNESEVSLLLEKAENLRRCFNGVMAYIEIEDD